MIGLLRRKNPLKNSKLGRGVGSEAGYGHEREYVRLSLNAHSAHKLILDTSLGAPKIRSARTGSSDERTAIFECESRRNRFRYSNVERDILLIGERRIRCGEMKVEIRAYALQHAVLFARLPEIDGALANKIVVRVWRNARQGLDLSEFYANILGLNALRTQTNLDGLNEESKN